MHERAARLGGTLAIESAPDTGTRLTARLPHRDQPAITAQSE
jgi:signal transduction histidine kinase